MANFVKKFEYGDFDNFDEIVGIFDENNKSKGFATRKEMREKNLIHRSTSIFLLDHRNHEIYIHLRSARKERFPLNYCITFGGVVQYQEEPKFNAQRELSEECGLAFPEEKFIEIDSDYYEDATTKTFRYNYVVFCDTPINELTPQESEVKSISKISLNKLDKLLRDEPTCDEIYDVTCPFTPESRGQFLKAKWFMDQLH